MNFESRLAALVTTAFATTLCATSVLAAGDVPSGDGFQQLHSFTHYSDPQGPFGESPIRRC